MHGLETINRLNAQKTGDHSWKHKGAEYTIAEVDGVRKTFVGRSELPLGAKIIEQVGV